ncbi:Annexin [Aphelenchoides besseyi]|nr:Annexin [Aphelenchoides besseyi]KAI6235868.1 Annexin [Aphelenchoides besseyi]
MPGFINNIVGGIAKAAAEHIGGGQNRQQQQPTYNAGDSYSSNSQSYNTSSGYSAPQTSPYSGNYGQQAYPNAYGNSSPYPNAYSGTSPYPNESGQGYQPMPNSGSSGQIGFNVNSSGYTPYPQAQQNTGYPPSSYDQPSSHYLPSNYPSSNYQPYPSHNQQVHNVHSSDSIHQFSHHGSMHSHHPANMYSNPSIKPYPHFNASQDAEVLRNAMKGFGCNKDKVIMVLCGRNNQQRQEISRVFKTMYGKDLIKDLKSELHGDFEHLIMALMELPVNYDAHQLHKAMARIGTRENVLIEIMTTRTNAQIQQLKHAYRQLYGKELEDHLVSETSGYFKRMLISMCAGGRDESGRTDQLKANQDARSLYRAGEQRLGTDEAQFNAILAAQNFVQLRLVFDEYQKVTGHSIEQAVQNEFSGDIRDGLLSIIKSVRNRGAYFAELLHDSMKGLGTRDTDLVRIIVTRSEIDLGDIRNEYHRMFGQSLEQAISSDCSGAYKGIVAYSDFHRLINQ